ncbi:hypothetical protein P4S68_16960 [Pseudoalteromonas sp. Hal099]
MVEKYGDTANTERTLYFASLAGDNKEALKAVETLLKTQPNNSEYLTKAMHLNLANGNANAAEQLIAKLLLKTPQ